jgi:L-lysine exporter family protein LysE/ArgO
MLSAASLLAAVSGLALGLGLIVAIGAQNAFVLRQGLRLEHVTAAVVVCTASDLALIAVGVLGAGAALSRVPWLISVVCSAGAAFLLTYGFHAARRALRPGVLRHEAAGARNGLAVTVTTDLALTWLNPHVYLDTMVLLGSVSSTYGPYRWEFAAGAGLASLLWFSALGYGAYLLRPAFARLVAWRVLDAAIAVIMTVLGILLAVRGAAAILVISGVTAFVVSTLAGRVGRRAKRRRWPGSRLRCGWVRPKEVFTAATEGRSAKTKGQQWRRQSLTTATSPPALPEASPTCC